MSPVSRQYSKRAEQLTFTQPIGRTASFVWLYIGLEYSSSARRGEWVVHGGWLNTYTH